MDGVVLRTGALLALVAASCMHHEGTGWETPAPARTDPISLVLLGDAGLPGSIAAETAAHLSRVLDAEREAGHFPKVIWLGDNILGGCPTAPWNRPGSRELAHTVRAHVGDGGHAYAVMGDEDRTCPQATALQADTDGPQPWAMPAPSYVVRLDQVGGARLVSQCENTGCVLEESTELALVDLVFLDSAGWIRDEPPGRAKGLDRLLEAVRTTSGPPRLLVTHIPVESAGFRGLGGGMADASVRYLPPALRTALTDGIFVGVLSGHDRNLQVIPDLSDALMRSESVPLPHPVFQIISGAASDPDARNPIRRIGRRRGVTASPILSSDHPGFVVLQITPRTVDVILHARRGRTWKTGAISLGLVATPLPPDRPVGSQTPCKDCPVVPAPARP